MIMKKKFQIALDPKYGRYLKCREFISAGEIIIDEDSIVSGPSPSSSSSKSICPVCYKTMNNTTKYACTLCGLTLCSIVCSTNIQHINNECSVFKISPLLHNILKSKVDLYQFITLIRCLKTKQEDPIKWNQILQLQSKTPVISPQLKDAFDFLPLELKQDSIFCLGLLQTNSFSDLKSNKNVEHLYFFSSFMNHSCIPNTDRIFESDDISSRVFVIAGRDIEIGESITNTYVPILLNTWERYNILVKEPWNFTCDCLRCSHESEFDTFLGCMECPLCKSISLSPSISASIIQWSCLSCKTTVNIQSIEEMLQKLKMIENQFEDFNWLETNNESWLGRNHSLLVNLKYQLCQNQNPGEMSNGILDKCLSYSEDLVLVLDKLFPNSVHIIKGRILFRIWLFKYEIFKRRGEESCIDVDKYGKLALDILQFSPPGTDEWKMKTILEELINYE